MALPAQLAVQNLQFLQLAVRFVRHVWRRFIPNIQRAPAVLAVAQNIINIGSQWLHFMLLILRYLRKRKRRKKDMLVNPHLLIQLM